MPTEFIIMSWAYGSLRLAKMLGVYEKADDEASESWGSMINGNGKY